MEIPDEDAVLLAFRHASRADSAMRHVRAIRSSPGTSETKMIPHGEEDFRGFFEGWTPVEWMALLLLLILLIVTIYLISESLGWYCRWQLQQWSRRHHSQDRNKSEADTSDRCALRARPPLDHGPDRP